MKMVSQKEKQKSWQEPRRLCFIILVLYLLIPSASHAADKFNFNNFTEVRIDGLDRKNMLRLIHMGIDIEGLRKHPTGISSKGKLSVRAYIGSEQIEELRKMGYEVSSVPHPLKRNPSLRQGYHTYSELTSELQAIESAHPDICRLYNIGKSAQGRELWFMKISDNVDAEEDEPEFKYISSMHGDETVGMELCLKLIRLLAEGYGNDARITHLLDEIEIWIMPLMNPDGYENGSRYNSEGADLNRGFPDRVSDPNNTTEGRSPEIQHVMNWGFEHSPVLSANFHTGAAVVNYPYDSDPDKWADVSFTPDKELFIQQAMSYASLNSRMVNNPEFSDGITNGLKWYPVYGGMQDWNYVWMGCNEVTIELCDNKWPAYSEIETLWEENKEAMLAYMAWCLRGVRGVVRDSVTGVPLNASVSVVDPAHENDHENAHNVYTDPDVGDYHRMLLPGTYSLLFSAEGYDSKTISDVAVGETEAVRADVEMISIVSGDINKDGRADLADCILILRILTGKEMPLSFDKNDKKRDWDGDRKLGIGDVVYILRDLSK